MKKSIDNLLTKLSPKALNLIRHFINKKNLRGVEWLFLQEIVETYVDDFDGEVYQETLNPMVEFTLPLKQLGMPGFDYLEKKLNKIHPGIVVTVTVDETTL